MFNVHWENSVSSPSCFPLPWCITDTTVLPTLLEIVNGVEVGKEHEMTFSMAELCLPTLALWQTDWALPTCSTDWVWAGAWRHSPAWTPRTKPWFWQSGGWGWHHMNEWNRVTHVKPCMLSSGWDYPGERCSKGPCLKYLAIQTHSFDVHKILPSLLKLFRWSSSPRHGSSSVQDPSNIRKYSIYPSQWWGSQDRKTSGPGVVLEGCEGATVLLLTQPPPPGSGCTPAAPRGWSQPGSCPTLCPSAPCPWPLCLSPWQQLAAAIGYGIWSLCSTQTRHTFISKNQAGIFQHWHQFWVGFQKRDFSHLHVIKPY